MFLALTLPVVGVGLLLIALLTSLLFTIVGTIFGLLFVFLRIFVRFLLPLGVLAFCFYAFSSLCCMRWPVYCAHCQRGSLTIWLVMGSLLVGILLGRS